MKRVDAKKKPSAAAAPKRKTTTAERTNPQRENSHKLFQRGPGVYATAAVNRTRTRDTLD